MQTDHRNECATLRSRGGYDTQFEKEFIHASKIHV
jgi:hypothetical protein